jgi:hypothetical protein
MFSLKMLKLYSISAFLITSNAMNKNRINSLVRNSKIANKVILKAGSIMLKSSFKTSKTIFGLYKKAGMKAIEVGKELFKESLDIALETHRNNVKTSSEALKVTVETMREGNVGVEVVSTKKVVPKKKKKETTMNDLLVSEA